MKTIKQEDFIQSVADAFQFISYYHPVDFLSAMGEAYERERSPAAKNAIGQILINSRMAAEGHRPVCQDTGIAVVFLKIGMNVRWDATMSVQEMVNEGVRRAYTDKDNPLRASVLTDPDGERKNTRDNAPAVVHMEVVPGDRSRSSSRRRAAARRASRASRCSTRATTWWSGSSARCRPWAATGARPGCSVSASAVRRRRRW